MFYDYDKKEYSGPRGEKFFPAEPEKEGETIHIVSVNDNHEFDMVGMRIYYRSTEKEAWTPRGLRKHDADDLLFQIVVNKNSSNYEKNHWVGTSYGFGIGFFNDLKTVMEKTQKWLEENAVKPSDDKWKGSRQWTLPREKKSTS